MPINAKNTTLVNMIEKKRKCRRSSCRVYASTLVRINREFSDKPMNSDLKWLQEDADKILDKIKRLSSVNVARNLMSAAIIGLNILGDSQAKAKYNAVLKGLNERKNQMQQEGLLTEKQKSVTVPWTRIVNLRKLLTKEVRLASLYTRDKLTMKDFNKIQRALVLSLYTLLPVVRLDYADLEFVSENEFEQIENKDERNLLVTKRGGYKIYWNHFKTSRSLGEVIVHVKKFSPLLQRLLVTHIKYLKKHFPDNRFLLLQTNLSGQKLSRNALTRYLQRLFQQYFRKKISSTALRRIFLSHKFDRKDLLEQENLHRAMMHSRSTAIADYVR